MTTEPMEAQTIADRCRALVVDRAADGDFRVHQAVYTDPAVFDAELRRFFERGWMFVAHESQLPNPNDFLTVRLGRQPVLVVRDAAGRLGAFFNRCRHRGAVVCRERAGNSKSFMCLYHGWTYRADGSLDAVAGRDGYPEDFDMTKMGLVPVPKLAVYRGFVFAAASPDAPAIEDYLGNAKPYLDRLLDLRGGTVAVAPGTTSYEFKGNWKLQVENALDFYHLPFVHASFFEIKKARGEHAKMSARHLAGDFSLALGNGHGTVLNHGPDGKVHQHLYLFPNLVILENPAPQFRVIEPLAVDHTRVRGYIFFDDAMDDARRDTALRLYERFYGPTGFGTPDDVEVFHACMEGFQAELAPWNDLTRGLWRETGEMPEDGYGPVEAAGNITDDTFLRGLYRWWSTELGRPETAS